MNFPNVKNQYIFFLTYWKKGKSERLKTKAYQHAQQLRKIVKYDQSLHKKRKRIKSESNKVKRVNHFGYCKDRNIQKTLSIEGFITELKICVTFCFQIDS